MLTNRSRPICRREVNLCNTQYLPSVENEMEVIYFKWVNFAMLLAIGNRFSHVITRDWQIYLKSNQSEMIQIDSKANFKSGPVSLDVR